MRVIRARFRDWNGDERYRRKPRFHSRRRRFFVLLFSSLCVLYFLSSKQVLLRPSFTNVPDVPYRYIVYSHEYLFITIINNNKPFFPSLILSSFEAQSFRSNIYNEIFQFVNSDPYSRAFQTIFLFTRTISFQFVRSTMILFLCASRLTNRFNRAGISG